MMTNILCNANQWTEVATVSCGIDVGAQHEFKYVTSTTNPNNNDAINSADIFVGGRWCELPAGNSLWIYSDYDVNVYVTEGGGLF